MKVIKIKDEFGKKCLVNMDAVAYYYAVSENATTITFIGGNENFIRTNIPIKEFEKLLLTVSGEDAFWETI